MADRIESFRDLDVWQEGMELVVECYRLTDTFPKTEHYGGLASQTQRAATSIPTNIAEGKVRPTKAFKNHVSIALGSQAELDTLFEVALRLKYVSADRLDSVRDRLNRLGRMLNRLFSALERRLEAQRPGTTDPRS
jgi:four helix bundle protein